MNVVNGLFVDASARTRFDRLYAAFIGAPLDFDPVLRRSKTFIVVHALAGDLNRLAGALTRIARRDRTPAISRATASAARSSRSIACFPVYARMRRRPALPTTTAATSTGRSPWRKRESPAAETSIYDFIGATLRGDLRPSDPDVADALGRFVVRFQQLTAPVTAKGMEDTAFYVYDRLVSLNEVGGNPGTFGFTSRPFHGASQDRAQTWPHTMLATATHDNKRGEDVRTRIDVLSGDAGAWGSRCGASARSTGAIARPWTASPRRRATTNTCSTRRSRRVAARSPGRCGARAFALASRPTCRKAAREAKVHTSWVNPHRGYESALARFIDGLLGGLEPNRFLQEFLPLQARVAHHGCLNSLAQIAIKLTSPGVPDVYQGPSCGT
jgi:(1->4)-alpha-D-glucan 1-alpha-D-glucosylmutase